MRSIVGPSVVSPPSGGTHPCHRRPDRKRSRPSLASQGRSARLPLCGTDGPDCSRLSATMLATSMSPPRPPKSWAVRGRNNRRRIDGAAVRPPGSPIKSALQGVVQHKGESRSLTVLFVDVPESSWSPGQGSGLLEPSGRVPRSAVGGFAAESVSLFLDLPLGGDGRG